VSLLSRISGMLDSFHKIELEEKDRYGAGGEDEVEELIRRGGWAYVRNPLAPHPSKPGVFLESDLLVHVNGGLFGVEVKKVIGRIEYDDREHRYVRQVKQGRYGEGAFVMRLSNPVQKTNSFAGRLKGYLLRVEPRFRQVCIGAVAAFAPTAHISAIHDPAGLIYTTEVPEFLAHQSRASDGRQRPWLAQALRHVPTWDRVETVQGELMYGLFTQPALVFKDRSMKKSTIPFADVAEVRLKRGGLFSDASDATIQLLTGEVVQTRVAFGNLRLDRFGSVQVHKLRNLRRIMPGVACIRGGRAAG